MATSSSYRYPFPPFPAGWFAVSFTDELPVRGIRPLKVLGRDLVLFRGEDGVARVFDAWCPHLGAHLGYASTVVGNGIRCPFHHWTYDGSGACVSIPYSTRAIPQQAKVRSWEVRELNQAIFVWHDPDGAPPTWELPVVAEAGAAGWTRLRSIDRAARFHCQEIRENGVDSAHFGAVHDFPTSAFDVRAEGTTFHQVSQLTAQLGPAAASTAQLSVAYHGLGYGVARQNIGEIQVLVISHVTPIDDEMTQLRFAVSLRRLPSVRAAGSLVAHIREAGGKQGLLGVLRRQLAQLSPGGGAKQAWDAIRDVARGLSGSNAPELLRDALTQVIALPATAEVARQLDQDIYITERKLYYTKPLLRDGEQTIRAMRQWAQQFYPQEERRHRLPVTQAGAAGAVAVDAAPR